MRKLIYYWVQNKLPEIQKAESVIINKRTLKFFHGGLHWIISKNITGKISVRL